MSPDKVGAEYGGFLVIAVPGGRGGSKPLEDWIFRHHETKQEAEAAARGFAAQAEGFQAFVIPATGYFYRPLGT